jgi:hypothetical protein
VPIAVIPVIAGSDLGSSFTLVEAESVKVGPFFSASSAATACLHIATAFIKLHGW